MYVNLTLLSVANVRVFVGGSIFINGLVYYF